MTYLKHSKDGKHFAHFIGMHHFGDHRSEHGGRGGVKDSNEATNIEHPLIDGKGKEQQVDDCCESICKEKRRIFIEVTDPQCSKQNTVPCTSRANCARHMHHLLSVPIRVGNLMRSRSIN